MFHDTLGPYSLNTRDQKRKDLLCLLKSNHFKLLLSYFHHKNDIAYKSFNVYKTPHTLDNFICCSEFCKRVTNCKTSKHGVKSDHSAVLVKFKLTSIKQNNMKADILAIDWKLIREIKEVNEMFNKKLHYLLMKNQITNFTPKKSDICIYKPAEGK